MKKNKNKASNIFVEQFKKRYLLFTMLLLLVIFYFALYKVYMPRVNAFGCFDDCNNFMGGYFLLHGKRLFTEIFFNHNPFMAYISFLVQLATHPENLYELILRHRQALFLFSFVFNVILIIRFGTPAFLFALFYELTKFYLFGDRFLAEPFIVYPLVYLAGLTWLKLQNKTIRVVDYIFAGIFVWFILFMREPYVPVALLVFGYLLFVNENFLGIRNSLVPRSDSLTTKKFYSFTKNSMFGFWAFIVLTAITFGLHDVKEFYFNVVKVNIALVGLESDGIGPKIFFYPFTLFFGGEWGHFRYVILSLNILFLISNIYMLWKKKWETVIFFFVILGFLNIRYVEPGKVFYGAFHLLCWYGVFIFISFLMLSYIYKKNKKISLLMGLLYVFIMLFHIIAPSSFLHTKLDPHYELITNYGIPMQVGNVIKLLSKPTDTLFLDGFDDIIYWQSQRFSTYPYSWYTSLMPFNKKYVDARFQMFKKLPPDFYYGSCLKNEYVAKVLPKFVKNDYVRLYSDMNPSCLWVKKSKLRFISNEQWKEAELNHYSLSHMKKK